MCVVGSTFFMNAANCVAAGSAAAANARIAKRMTVFMAICVSEQTGRTMLLATWVRHTGAHESRIKA